MRHLEDLRLTFERDAAVRAEEARMRALPQVAGAIEHVTAVAVVEHVRGRFLAVRLLIEEERAPRVLLRRQRVVEIVDWIRRIADLQREIRERGHVRVAQERRAPDQPGNATLNDVNARNSLNMPEFGWAESTGVPFASKNGRPVC